MTSNTKASVTALGGGTGMAIVYLTDLISDPTYKQAALYLAPVAAVAVTTILTWISHFGGRELQIIYRQRDLGRARRQLAEILDNPNSSETLRKQATASVEKQELDILNLKLATVPTAAPK